MNTNNKTNHWASWLFVAFGALLVIINAALTFSFGFAYLGRSFGLGIVSDYVGAFYALLLFDAGYTAWFYTYLRTAESTGQRSLALGMSMFSLLGSLAATIQQLATNSTELIDLSGYHQTVGLIALFTMLFMTAAHIVATASYVLLDPRERVKQVMAAARANALDSSLQVAEQMVQIDHKDLVAVMSAEVRADILASLGFTTQVEHISQTSNELADELFGKKQQQLPQPAPENDPLVIDDNNANVTPLKRENGDNYSENADKSGDNANFTTPSSQ